MTYEMDKGRPARHPLRGLRDRAELHQQGGNLHMHAQEGTDRDGPDAGRGKNDLPAARQPIPYTLTPTGRAIAAAYKQRQEGMK